MKPLFFKVPNSTEGSIKIQVETDPRFYNKLHYHPEFQVTLITKGEGTLFVGDGVHRFSEGDLILLGSNLPHLFKNDPLPEQDSISGIYAISYFFDIQIFGDDFFELHELKPTKLLLEQAKLGIRFKAHCLKEICESIESLSENQGFNLLIKFFEVMNRLSQEPRREILSTKKYIEAIEDVDNKKLNDIYHFIISNYKTITHLSEVAAHFNMSVSSFSRYFKLHTRKTFIQFLNEFRINVACKLIREGNFTISQICFQVGFNNLSNFNRQFKNITNLTPSAYMQLSNTYLADNMS